MNELKTKVNEEPPGRRGRFMVSVLPVLVIVSVAALAKVHAGVPGPADTTGSRREAIRAFLEEEVRFDRYLFPPGRFPSCGWRNPERVERLVGSVPLSAEFYDCDFMQVARAERPGRYGAVVKGITADGFELVRYATLYCCTADLDDYSPDVPLVFEPLQGFGIAPDRWDRYRREMRRFSFGSLMISPLHDPDAAVFLAGLSELKPDDGDTPRLRDRQWWTEFKRRRDPSHPVARLPEPPKISAAQRLPLQPSTLYSPGQIRHIREVCRTWADSAGMPLTVTVLHKGRLAFEGAFGRQTNGTPMSRDTQTWMASITKLLTGFLLMQFVDAGIVELDAPLDRYLPELGSSCPLSLRMLMTHTSGLSWAGEWASDWNPSMENQIAQAIPLLQPGREFSYHRAGYALTAKVLERLSGRTVPSLFHEFIFEPLGMLHAYADNTYGGLYSSSEELSRIGQCLLDHGKVGPARLLSESAWAAMLPRPLQINGVRLQRSWGIGCSPMGGKGLSDSTFGHAAASGALLRIDPVHELVVVLGRDGIGRDKRMYDRFVERFLRAVTAPWEK